MNESFAKAIDALLKVAPHIWAALIRQQYIDAVACLVWIIALLSVAKLIHSKALPLAKGDPEGAVMNVFGWLAILALGAISLGLTVSLVTCLLNPEYYAIKELLRGVE